MATSTEIQFLGDGGGVVDQSSNSTIESFFFSQAITAGDWVSIDHTIADLAVRVKTVRPTVAASAPSRAGVVGVALESVDPADPITYNGNKVKVCIAGGPVSAVAAATVVAGSVLVASGAANATGLNAVQADTVAFPLVIGVALTAEAAGFADVLVKRNLL